MKDNPFAKFAAAPAARDGGGGGGGWMSARRRGKDDSAIEEAKGAAAEARRAKNRRGGTWAAKAGGKGKARKGGGAKRRSRRRRDDFIDDSDEESFDGYSDEEEDEEDDFIAASGDEVEAGLSEEEEGDWDSGMDDDDEDFGGRKKKKNSKAQTKASSWPARAIRRDTRKSTWRPPSSQNSAGDDEIEESPVPPARGRAKRATKKKESPASLLLLDNDEDMSDVVDGGADRGGKSAGTPQSISSDAYSPSPAPKRKKVTKSKYFSGSSAEKDFGEEKKDEDDDDDDDENVFNGVRKKNANKKMWEESPDSGSDDDIFGSNPNDNLLDNDLSDTPRKSPRKPKANRAICDEDYVEDDDEAVALRVALAASMKDEDERKGKERKRLKKKSSKNGGRKVSSSSSLEDIKAASPAKDGPRYKDDVESLKDSDSDGTNEDDEMEVYEAVDEEEQTAAQVLAEANALSAKIVGVVGGWCGGLDGKDSVKGLILGEGDGALSLGSDGTKDGDWISNETMKEIMPNVKLAEYQLLGVNWMALLNRITFGKGGKGKSRKGGMNVNGILADEMGLGKTVQTIAFLAWLNHQSKNNDNNNNGEGKDAECVDVTPRRRRPHLIVVPASVLSNWMNEFKKFAPEMAVVKYHGNQVEREEIRCELDRYTWDNHRNEPLDAVLTTFSYFSSDSNKGDRSFLRKFEFDYLVVDEGHTLKNPKGLRYQNLKKFQTSHRLLLTGTPVQNSPKELMSLLCFLMPLFDSKTKSSKRKRGYDGDEDDDNDGGERMLEYFVHLEGGAAGDDAEAYRKLKQLFAPFVLRRKKEDVLGQILPPKMRTVDIVPMDEVTRIAYETILSSHVEARRKARANPTATKHLFTTLRKAANHPLLLRNRYMSEEEKDNLARLALDYHWFGNDQSCTLQLVRDELDKYSDYQVHCAAMQMIDENPARRQFLEKYTLLENDLFCSPKFVRLQTLLPELISEGHRILIFSQWTKVLDLMGHLMEHLDMKYLRLDGSTPVNERQGLIDTFNTDDSISVFLLSTRAGGMGLNLTSADTCILHDLDFNPFNDRQAEDRCHRIGQKKPVKIIKMVCGGTVDEDIYSIQERKTSMNEAIMEAGGKKRGKKSSESDEMCRLANAAVERFLMSPTRPAKTPAISAASTASSAAKYEDTVAVLNASGGEKKQTNDKTLRKRKITSINLSDSSADDDLMFE